MNAFACFAVIALTAVSISAQHFSIVALADPRRDHTTFGRALAEIKDRNALGDVGAPRYIIVAGDIDPYQNNFDKYTSTFPDASTRPELLPVIGNHDFESSADYSGVISTINDLKNVHHPDSKGNYYVDHENVRIIALNGYTHDGNTMAAGGGCINAEGLAWTNDAIESATHADHVFISFHEPAFPRGRHTGDSFNSCARDRNDFWNMLLSHGSKVKAVIVGHTHAYSRVRVNDPTSAEANNSSAFPDQEGGIYQIDAGACGNGSRNTVVNMEIVDKNVNFKVVDCVDGQDKPFSVIDQWSISTATSPPAAPSMLSAGEITSSGAVLSWKDNSSDEVGFVIEMKAGSGFEEVARTVVNKTSRFVAGLSPATTYECRIAAYNSMGLSPYPQSVSFTTADAQGGEVVWAVNCGGSDYTATSATVFAADNHASGGFANQNDAVDIADTDDDVLYLSERYGNPFSYEVPVAPDDYSLTLHFCEMYVTAAGKRIFSVTVEGEPFVSDLDVFARVGGANAFQIEKNVTIEDGGLSVDFASSVQNAFVNALELRRVGTVSARQAVAGASSAKELLESISAVSGQRFLRVRIPAGSRENTTLSAYSLRGQLLFRQSIEGSHGREAQGRSTLVPLNRQAGDVIILHLRHDGGELRQVVSCPAVRRRDH